MEYVSFIFILLGIFVHLLLLYSIFDIYYSSPIVKGARNFQIIASNFSAPPPADRLVFFSADGLRARTFFEHPERSPFLHSLIQNGKAASGISQSHVPTESRPGHVALMAGFYEDVSAVTHGWKHNPVPFDSTLNQSARAYLWGSPDIVHLFSTNIANAYAEVYASELEDFASLDAAQLDKWVFERVEALLQRAKNDMSLARQVSTKRSIFFLHLLGLDTNGHGYMPRSEQYLANIQTVDKGVKQIYELFETHFADNKTAYLFTADHGMTDWGSHGDGTDDEVQIPFIGWGAGIEATNKNTKNMKQPFLAQVDIAPLQSALIGVSIPVNSFGIMPAELLRTASGGMATEKYRFQAAYANFKQMSEQFSIRRAERRAHSFRYLFTECPSLRFDALVRIENEILRLAQLKRYEAAWKACIKWIPIIREALNYFHRYHRLSQGIAIGTLFCSWNFALYASLIGHYQHFSLYQLYIPSHPFWLALFMAAALVWAQGLSFANYLYFLAPIFLLSTSLNMLGLDWMELYGKMQILSFQFGKKNFDKMLKKWTQRVGAMFICAAFFIPLLVSVFFERSILSLIFMVISIVPWLFLSNRNSNNFSFRVSWLILCLALAIFPLLDTVGTWPRPWLVILTETICCVALQQFNRKQKENTHQKAIQIVEIFHWTTLCLLIWDAIMGPNVLIQLFAWLYIPTAFCLPLLPFNRNQIPNLALADRLILWSASLQLPYSLLSLGQEALFLCLFTILLFLYARLQHPNDAEFWTNQHTLVVEGGSKKKRESNELANRFKEKYILIKENENPSNDHLASISEWSRALFLVICIEMAFFGTGNIASLNSFNPNFLRLFLSVFSPFTMATLLLLKVFIPFLIVSIHFVAFNNDANEIETPNKLAKLSTHMALITNSMAMIFFYCLRTDGSWLQIGISISNYVICLVCSAATYLLLHFSNYLFHSHKLPKFLNSSLKYYI